MKVCVVTLELVLVQLAPHCFQVDADALGHLLDLRIVHQVFHRVQLVQDVVESGDPPLDRADAVPHP